MNGGMTVGNFKLSDYLVLMSSQFVPIVSSTYWCLLI